MSAVGCHHSSWTTCGVSIRGGKLHPCPHSRVCAVIWWGQVRRRLEAGLAPIVALRGPRQVGTTTAQYQIISDLLDEGVPPTSILKSPVSMNWTL